MFKTIILLSVVAAALAAPALADGRRDQPTQQSVPTRGYDFTDAGDIRILHDRLRRAARSLCDSRMPRQLGARMSDRACARESLDRAVAALGQPLMTAYHDGQPITSRERQLALSSH
ncbi:UrcA family protein [Phenylobacterium sp.]|uniref:UrcA family protein n=1 Tax=Phenylobacterium sp. TaxID=1871053 RepID=UPI003983228E